LCREDTRAKGAQGRTVVDSFVPNDQNRIDITKTGPPSASLAPEKDEIDDAGVRERSTQGVSEYALFLRPPSL